MLFDKLKATKFLDKKIKLSPWWTKVKMVPTNNLFEKSKFANLLDKEDKIVTLVDIGLNGPDSRILEAIGKNLVMMYLVLEGGVRKRTW
jgi:hypothetical protein